MCRTTSRPPCYLVNLVPLLWTWHPFVRCHAKEIAFPVSHLCPVSGTMPLEAALLQDMKHDYIVNLLKHKFATTSQQERQLWLVMEYCDKGPLDVRHPAPHIL